MELKEICIGIGLAALTGTIGYVAGAHSQPASVQAETHQEEQRDTHVETTKVVTKDPKTGTVTTTVVKDATTKTETKSDVSIKETKKNVINISALGGYDIYSRRPIYGVSVSKEVLGPVTAGGFILNNGTIGVSVGLDF